MITSPAEVVVDGEVRRVAHWFGDSRVIVDYEGVYVFVDRALGGEWELSGVPTRPEERAVLDSLIAETLDKTVVRVEKD